MSKTPEETRVADEIVTLKVAANSDVGKVAGAIVKFMAEGRKVCLSAIGAGAVNQSVKAIAVARGMVASQGLNLYCIPSFQNERFVRDDPALMKTAIKLSVYDLKL